MARRSIAPFGHWPSPITPETLAMGQRPIGLVQVDGDHVYWIEGRPAEGGRQSIMRARPGKAPEELLVAPWSARSRVHEYGGGDFLAADGTVYFISDPEQRLYELTPGAAPVAVGTPQGLRLADFALDRSRARLIAVAERATSDPHRPENFVAAIGLEGRSRGKVAALAEGRDFYAFPRLDLHGRQLAFIAWDLPDMPWDQAALYVARVGDDGSLRKPRRVTGGNGVAISEPLWLDDGRLAFISDRSGRGQVEIFDGKATRALTSDEADYGRPLWLLGHRSVVQSARGTLLASRQRAGRTELVEIDPQSGQTTVRDFDGASLGGLSALGEGAAAVMGRHAATFVLTSLAPRRPAVVIRRVSDLALPADAVSKAEPISFPGHGGATTHAYFYAPQSATHRGPAGARPPAIVLAHGGPTTASDPSLKLRIQYYTSRGFAVCDVNYAGSTGYGRAYRERLDGNWGIADVGDCAAAARYMAEQGRAAADRIGIAGGSAGGYTTLMALATTGVFAAGSSHYGISDLALLLAHTHKFEAGYLHRLLGTTARNWKRRFRERSPLALIERIRAPVILFQGLEDRVVPPDQSRAIVASLKQRGLDVEHHEFAGEGHGFRQAQSIVAVAEAELAFFRRVLCVSP